MRLVLAALALAALAACAPAAEPILEQGRITIAANETLYDATLSVVNAETDDERCVVLSETDLACVLGTIPAGQETYVLIDSTGATSCIAFAFLAPESVGSYRPYPCSIE